MTEQNDDGTKLSLDYQFTSEEIKILARYFRNNQSCIPNGLEEFAAALERTVYNSMSIDEAEKFYS